MKQRKPQRKTRSTNAAGIFEKWRRVFESMTSSAG
jgi:hypothetical protein